MSDQSERLQEREAGLREALDVAAQHMRRGRLEEAMEVFRRVFEIDPNNFEAAVGVADVLLASGRTGDAIMAYGSALKANPEGSVGLFVNRGTALIQANDPEAASLSFRRAVDLEPENVMALNNLGSALAQLGRVQEALDLFRRAQAIAPDNPSGYFNAALALAALDPAAGQEAAMAAYRKAIACDPKFAPAYVNLAQILVARGEVAAALDLVDEAELHAPKDLPLLITKGQVLEAMGEYGNAVAVFDRAVLLYPQDGDALISLARAALAAGKLKKSIATCFDLLGIDGEHQAAKLILGHALLEDGKATRARETLEEVAGLPGAGHLLRRIAWAEGERDPWADLAAEAVAQPPATQRRLWDGSRTADGVLLDASAAGAEDIIQLARLLPELGERCGHLVLRTEPLFGPLLESVPGLSAVAYEDGAVPDGLPLAMPLAAMPGALGYRQTDLPARVPYLAPQAGRERGWDQGLFVANEPVVGICWQQRNRAVGPDQDLPFRALEPLFEEVPARFLSFAYRNGPNDAGLMADFGIQDIAAACRDLDDVAAAISQLDFVITCDGLIPHLAGALGKECWLLLPVFADWRWGRRGTACPFYPSLRLFRAERTGDWASVVADVAAELRERTG